jgi:hypothetical protein
MSARNRSPRRWFGAVPLLAVGLAEQSRFADAAHCGHGGFSARLSWHEIFSQCAEARACTRSSSTQTSPTATRPLPLGIEPDSSSKHWAVATSAPAASPVPTLGPPETRKALAANSTAPGEPEVRKAKPVTKEELSSSGRRRPIRLHQESERTKSSRHPAAQKNLREGDPRR